MKKRLFLLLSIIMILFPTVAFANVVWPSLYIAEGMRSFYVIALGLVVETVFVKLFEKQTWLRSVLICVIMNLASTLLGIILIPAVGFLGTLAIGFISDYLQIFGSSPDTAIWVFSYIITIFINVLVEGLTVSYTAKIPFKKTFWWLLLANTVSVLCCILVHGFTLSTLIK